MDGDHTMERCDEVTEAVLHAVFHALHRHKVILEHMILKPNMVLPGKDHPPKAAPERSPLRRQGAEASRSRGCSGHLISVRRAASGGSDGEPECDERPVSQRFPGSSRFPMVVRCRIPSSRHGRVRGKRLAAQQAFCLRAKMNGLARSGRWSSGWKKALDVERKGGGALRELSRGADIRLGILLPRGRGGNVYLRKGWKDGSARKLGCLRFLRRDRRSGLQEDLPRAAGADPSRPPGYADHRHGPRRLDAGQAARSGARQPRAQWRRRCRRVCETFGAAAVRRRRLPGSGDLRASAAGAGRGVAATALSRHSAEHVRDRGAGPGEGAAAPRTRESSSKSRSAATSPRRRRSTARCTKCFPSPRCSASTTISARRRCRTCCISALPTRSSSRSGTAISSTACRSPWPRISACRAAAAFTRRSARFATWCRTICCR